MQLSVIRLCVPASVAALLNSTLVEVASLAANYGLVLIGAATFFFHQNKIDGCVFCCEEWLEKRESLFF